MASSQILFRVVLLLPDSEKESPLMTGNSTWQLLCTSCGSGLLVLTGRLPLPVACSPCRNRPMSGSFSAGDGPGSWCFIPELDFGPYVLLLAPFPLPS